MQKKRAVDNVIAPGESHRSQLDHPFGNHELNLVRANLGADKRLENIYGQENRMPQWLH